MACGIYRDELIKTYFPEAGGEELPTLGIEIIDHNSHCIYCAQSVPAANSGVSVY